MKARFACESMKARSEEASLEVADVEQYRFCQALTVGINRFGAGRVAFEPQAHRLRPEGLSFGPLSEQFGRIVPTQEYGRRP